MKTQSEKWFEDFCANVGLACYPICVKKDGKTPDYQLEIDNQTIIVEVKEFNRNKNENLSDQLLKERGFGKVLTNTPGDRVRKKINNSSAQIKARTQGVHPGILVLCDIKNGCGQITGHTASYNIRIGMYGLEQIHISVPRDTAVSPYVTGTSYGPKRKMTMDQNTSISAIGVLSTPAKNDIRLDVYHNIYAAQPLNPELISKYRIRQFQLIEQQGGKITAQWKEIYISH